MQIRAEMTRKAIIDAAVELFDTRGYANVPVTDIIAHADVTKGSFHYHFLNREVVASAIIEEADVIVSQASLAAISESASALESFVRGGIAMTNLFQSDALVRVGVELRGSLRHVSHVTSGFDKHRELVILALRNAVDGGEVRADLDINQVGHALWCAVLGNTQLCSATGESLRERYLDLLAVFFPGICTPESMPRLQELIQSERSSQRPALG